MKKKHYEAIAHVLRDAHARHIVTDSALETLAHELADIFEADNPQFSRAMFLDVIY